MVKVQAERSNRTFRYDAGEKPANGDGATRPSGLRGFLRRPEPHQLTALADEVHGSTTERPGHPNRVLGRETPPAVTVESVGVDDLGGLRRVDPAAAVGAFVRGAGLIRSPGERGRLTPAARTRRGGPREWRFFADNGSDDAHLGKAHGAGEGQAGVTQGFPRALLEQSPDGDREFRDETLGGSASRGQARRYALGEIRRSTKSDSRRAACTISRGRRPSEGGAARARSSPPAPRARGSRPPRAARRRARATTLCPSPTTWPRRSRA